MCVYTCVFFLFGLVKYIFRIPKSETSDLEILQALVLWINMYINILMLVLPNITQILINDLKNIMFLFSSC